jgi:hypothetical protein
MPIVLDGEEGRMRAEYFKIQEEFEVLNEDLRRIFMRKRELNARGEELFRALRRCVDEQVLGYARHEWEVGIPKSMRDIVS